MALAEDILDAHRRDATRPREADFEEWDLDALKREVDARLRASTPTRRSTSTRPDVGRDPRRALGARSSSRYDEKEKLVGREVLQRVERDIMLQIVDAQWKDHLYSLDHLKEGIGLRGYGQRDPLVEYKKESFELFQAMKERVDEEIVRYLWWLRPVLDATTARGRRRRAVRRRAAAPLILNDPAAESAPSAFGGAARAGAAAPRPFGAPRGAAAAARRRRRCAVKTVRRDEPKVGRNDPCPCGSGKKYKKCHGAAA